MTRLDCSKAEERIVEDLDEGLNTKDRKLLEEHLQACPDCRVFKEEMKRVLDMVAEDKPEAPGELYWKRYDSSLEARWEERNRKKPRTWVWRLTAVAAAMAMFFIGVKFIQTPTLSPINSSPVALDLDTDLEELYLPAALTGAPEPSLDTLLANSNERSLDDEEIICAWFGVDESLRLANGSSDLLPNGVRFFVDM
jgi:hypothetical protein